MTAAALDGTPRAPADYRGQAVVLSVWATWCPPCIVETPGFVDLQEEFAGEFPFLGPLQDEAPAAVRAFAERHDVGYPLLVGSPPEGVLPPKAVLPTPFVIDRKDRTRMRHEGLLVEPRSRSSSACSPPSASP